jgi:hypothetical protein
MTEKQSVKEFYDKVNWLNEIEYGDFKRKVGLYLNRLEENLKTQNPEAHSLLNRIKDTVVFNPSGEIEATRMKALELSQKLIDLV